MKFQVFFLKNSKRKLITFLILIILFCFFVTSIPVNAGLFGEKIKKISDNELKEVIKVELNLSRDPNFYPYTDSMLKEALDKEINFQETLGFTFGSFILDALYEEKLVEMCYPNFNDKKSSEFFSKLADNLSDWQNNFASKITKLAILGAVQALGMPTLGIGISTLFLAIDLSEINISIVELEKAACNYKLFLYLNDRYVGNSHETAFAEMDLPLLWSDKKKQATENYFLSLWGKYGYAILSNDLAGFKEEQHEMLRELILQALNQPPNPPTSMIQFKSDGKTILKIGKTTSEQTVILKTKISDLDGNEVRLQIEIRRLDEYGGRGYRLVGFGYKKLQGDEAAKIQSKNLKDFEWLGILIYEDPVRKGVKLTLKECQKAGIKVRVITGDYVSTAIAVLRQLDLKLNRKTQVIEGTELEKISEKELAKKVSNVILFARTTPEQKLKIVKALKDNGEVVAMTGDGVNDALALKQADIGIVVGEASDVAKETADMVLLDSNFSTIVHAVEEGRTIFENIKKVVVYLLSDSFTEVILIGGSLLLKLPLPVTAAQILWVNLVEDTLPDIALAFESKEKEVMLELPRDRTAPLLDVEMKTLIFIIGIFTDLLLFGLYFLFLRGFFHLRYIQTVMFVALGIDSLFYVFACRSLRKTFFHEHPFKNKTLNIAVLISFFLLLIAVYFPPLDCLLHTHPLGIREWFLLLSLGIFELTAIELTKWFFISSRARNKVLQ